VDADYMEAVLDLVATIPAGRVMTYGSVAEVLRDRLGRGGARQVGQVLARAGGGVPWWRVVNASGEPPAAYRSDALETLRSEGCPLREDAADHRTTRVDLRRAIWWPDTSAVSASPAES
jgi:methylated-DNA-protein-cysteine methyltransferase related protein